MSNSQAEPTILDRDGFFKNRNRRRTKVVTIPGLGDVKIRALKERERSQYERSLLDDVGDVDADKLLTAKRNLIVLCVVDADCEPILTMGDVEALGDLDGAVTNCLFNEISDFCGISKKDIAELMGNSNSTTDAGSS